MILLLKMHASGKIFDKVCLKAIRDTIFSKMWSVIRGQGDSVFCWGDIQQMGKVKTFCFAGRPPKFPPLVGYRHA